MYELHVGDYVETVEGEVGYLTEFSISGNHFWGKVMMKDEHWHYAIYFNQFPDYFKRIGKYEFNTKMKHLECKITDDHRVFNKINEIIDWINSHEV